MCPKATTTIMEDREILNGEMEELTILAFSSYIKPHVTVLKSEKIKKSLADIAVIADLLEKNF